MSISPVNCPDSSCYWSAHGIPDQYTQARDWHLAAHRAEEHDEPLTAEQLAYATKAGHVIPASALTAAAVAAQGALPPPVGDQTQPLDDARLAEIAARVEAASRGPWTLAYESCDCSEDCGHGPCVSRLDTGAGPATELLDLPSADWELMAHAREDVPALLAAVAYHRHWEQVGWQKAHAYNERWVRADDRLAEERHLVARLRKELSRQGRAHEAEIERLKADLAEAHQQKAAVLASARQLMNRNRTEEAS